MKRNREKDDTKPQVAAEGQDQSPYERAPRTEREIEEREAKTWIDDRQLKSDAGYAVVDDTHLKTAMNPGAPADNIIGHGSTQGQDRGSAQIGGRGRGSQVGSEFDTDDED